MIEAIALAALANFVAQHAPSFLTTLRDTILDKSKEATADKGKELILKKGDDYFRQFFHLDEKEQIRHLDQALKNATERGLARFYALQERDIYRSILQTLYQDGPFGEALRKEALRLFTFSDTPDFSLLNDKYNLRQSISAAAHNTDYNNVDITPYLTSFFDALIAELYADPYFKQQLSDTLQIRAFQNMQQSLLQVVTTLRQINAQLSDDYTAEQFARDVEKYAEYVERTFHYLEIRGVTLRGAKEDPELDGIFVPLRVDLQREETYVTDEGAMITNRLKPISLLEALEQYPCLVLLGGPGSGKSTAVRHLAWSHAIANRLASSTSHLSLLAGHPLPLRIELRLFSSERKQHNYNFLSYATEVLMGRAGIEINPHLFKELLTRRTMLLLFDGLDEVATLDERNRLVAEIENFAMSYPGNRIVVTSRPIGYELTCISHPQFTHAQVENFDNRQIRKFLERWYTHVLRLSPLPYDEQEELEKLFQTLRGNTRLHKLAENPLLLTVITALYRYERLPDRRFLVYERCAKLLLDTWAELKGTNARWNQIRMSKEDQYECVAHLGFVLHERSQEPDRENVVPLEDTANDVPPKFMLREIERFIKGQGLIIEVAQQRKEAERFFELMQVEAGLIVERGTDESGDPLYGFVHRTFQEYFAAVDVYVRYQDESEMIIIDFLKERLHDPHWYEVILLLLGKLRYKFVTKQLYQILQGNFNSLRSRYSNIIQQDLFFICDCLIEEITVESELAELLIARLSDVVKNAPFPSQRKKALDYFRRLVGTQKYRDLALKAMAILTIEDNVSDMSVRIQVAEALYSMSTTSSLERQNAIQGLLQVAQSPNVSFEDVVSSATTVYRISRDFSEERRQAGQLLLRLAQLSPDQAIEQIITAIGVLIRPRVNIRKKKSGSNKAEEKSAPPEPEERREARDLLLQLAQRPDLSVEQIILLTPLVNRWDSKQAKQLQLQILQRSDLSVEQTVRVSRELYQSTYKEEESQQARQLLLRLIQDSNLSAQEVFQVYQAYYEVSYTESEKQQAEELILHFAKSTDTPIEQAIQATEFLYHKTIEDKEKGPEAIRMLSSIVQRPNISTDQALTGAKALYSTAYWEPEQKQKAKQLLLNLAQDETLNITQRLSAAMFLAQMRVDTNGTEREARQFLPQFLRFIRRHFIEESPKDMDVSDVPYLVQLTQEKFLSLQDRDNIYDTLSRMVPEFNKIPTDSKPA